MIKTVQHIRTGNASPSSAEVPSLLSLLDALIAAGTGDELAVARHIDDLSRRLYQVPPAASIDLEAMARMRQIVTERSDDVALAVGAIEILAGWHQQIGAATLTEWLAVWLGEAAKRAERWVLVSADLGALADLARTVLALSTLFGMLEANPTDGVAFVELAAAALLHHRDHDQALSLAVAGFAWRQASGLPSGPLDAGIPISGARLLRSCADTALGSLTQQSRDPRRTVRESLAAYEMLGLEQQAQRTRLQLVLGMRSEGLLQSVEPLLEQLSQQRDEDPVVGAVIESVWVSVLWSRGDCERALSRAHTLLAGAPHQLRDTVTVQVATMLAAWRMATG